jgi:hypothetical protein
MYVLLLTFKTGEHEWSTFNSNEEGRRAREAWLKDSAIETVRIGTFEEDIPIREAKSTTIKSGTETGRYYGNIPFIGGDKE